MDSRDSQSIRRQMTNPLDPPSNDKKPDQEPAAEKASGSSGLSYDDVVKMQAKDEAARAQADAEKTGRAAQMERSGGQASQPAPSALSPFTYQMGHKPQFQIRKAEFLHEKLERPVADLKPLVDKFLKETPRPDEHGLTADQQRELEATREMLARVTNADDALATALELAKLYKHLQYIEEAKKATDLSLGIDPESHLGRELFKELEHLHLPEMGGAGTRPASAQFSKARLREKIQGLAAGRVIVVGDMVIDEFLEGAPERISREAPVLILEHVNTELVLGGAANAAHNVTALGGGCHGIGVCGRDSYSGKLAELFEVAGISQGLVQDPSRPTSVKTRILSRSHSFRQQLLRLDRMSHQPVDPAVESLLIERLKQVAGQYSAILLSDYRGGVITDAVARACSVIAAERGMKIVVDAQDRLDRFQQVTLLTPNEPDVERAVGFKIDSQESLERAGNKLLLLTGAHALLVTRGAQGMALFRPDCGIVKLPPFNKQEVFDVTGAGDTVAATMSLALATGCDFVEAMALGNLAAGIVVGKPGTATTSQSELLEALEFSDLPE